jgi:putative aldouronate transport system permease protein
MRKRFRPVDALLYGCAAAYALFCALPMALALAVSFTAEESIIRDGYRFLPRQLSLYAYSLVFGAGSSVMRSYGVSILVTVLGTVTAVLITTMAAYALSNRQVRYRSALALFFYVTMVFTSGIVPWYLVCLRLGLKNNLLALVVPSLLFSPFNLFLVKNYMDGIPESLKESARIDGAGDITTAFVIYVPLSVPVLATVTLFYGLSYWNDWWNAIMLVDNRRLFPLQYLLLLLRSQVRMIQDLQLGSAGAVTTTPPTESLKMATAMVTIGPIVMLYPWLQRFFIKGMVVGAIKG